MPPSSKNNAKRIKVPNWVQNPASQIVAIFSGCSLLIGTSFAFGKFYKESDFRLEKMELKQEFNEKLQQEINKCREEKLENYSKSVEDIKEVVKQIEKRTNDK